MSTLPTVTQIIQRIESGDENAAAELFPLVYEELRRMAKWKLADESTGHTLQPTALVNEVYVRLVGKNRELAFESRKGFFVAASEAMQHILVDAARRKHALKRGGEAIRIDMPLELLSVERCDELLDVHDALEALANQDPQCAELVKLHYFGGYSLAEAADLLNISRSTANRWWVYARAWLKDRVERERQSP